MPLCHGPDGAAEPFGDMHGNDGISRVPDVFIDTLKKSPTDGWDVEGRWVVLAQPFIELCEVSARAPLQGNCPAQNSLLAKLLQSCAFFKAGWQASGAVRHYPNVSHIYPLHPELPVCCLVTELYNFIVREAPPILERSLRPHPHRKFQQSHPSTLYILARAWAWHPVPPFWTPGP